jgi:hypothetical protein
MWMYKDVASSKWCPMARAAVVFYKRDETEEVVVSNRADDGSAQWGTRCLGGDCAVWVWESPTMDKGCCGFTTRGH